MEWDYEDDSSYFDAMMDAEADAMQAECERQQDEYREQEKKAKQFVSDLHEIMVKLLIEFNQIELDRDYVFRREGHFWIVGLEKPATLIEDSKGMSYIHQLLQNPHKEIPAIQFYSSLADRTKLLNKSKFVEFAEDKEDEIINVDSRTQQEIADTKTITACTKRLEEISSELNMANKNNDEVIITKLQDEKEKIENYLHQLKKHNGQTDTFSDTIEKARKAVSSAISRAIDSIKTHKADLYQYLKNAIHTGISCTYTPDKKIDWEL